MKALNNRLETVLAMSVHNLPVNVSSQAKEMAQQMRSYWTVKYPDGTPLANKKGKLDVIVQDVNNGAGTAAKPQAEQDVVIVVSSDIAPAAEAAGHFPKICKASQDNLGEFLG